MCVKPVHCRPIGPWNEVAVHIDDDLDGAVSKLLLDVGQRLPLLDEKTRVGMLQIVEPDAP